MILTHQQAQDVAQMMTVSPKIRMDTALQGSDIERVIVNHDRTCHILGDKVLVWQQLGGVTLNEETHADRAAFFSAYGLAMA